MNKELQITSGLTPQQGQALMEEIRLLKEDKLRLAQEKLELAREKMELIKEKMELISEIDLLKQRPTAEEHNSLKEDYEGLKKLTQELKEEMLRLKEQLGLNSTNSSLPPSRDLYKSKNKNRKNKSERKPGGQPGHKGHSYKPLPADETKDCRVERCACGSENIEVLEKCQKDQKLEIPPIKVHVTDYRRWYCKCKDCKKVTLAPLPDGVQQDLLGPHSKAIICALNGFYHNSKRDVQTILSQIFNLNISLGLIANTAQRVNKSLKAPYKALEEEIKQSKVVHIDETGHRNKGKRGWGWVFTNQISTLIKLTHTRGQKVLTELLKDYSGYVVSDRYPVYYYFASERRQLCWSHLLRDFERFANSLDANLSSKGAKLVKLAKSVFSLVERYKTGKVSEKYFGSQIEKLKDKMLLKLMEIHKLPDRKQAKGVTGRLIKDFDQMWRFLEDSIIEMTNNLAERQIRKYVMYRKKLLFTWSNWGQEFVERILSLYLTCRQQGVNAFLELKRCIA